VINSFNIRDEKQRKHKIEVLFEDEYLLVINKPAGLLVIPDHWDPTLPNLIELLTLRYEQSRNKEAQTLWVVHRIDKETSGLVLFARHPDMHSALNQWFEEGKIEKKYLAIVRGAPQRLKDTIDLPIHLSAGKKFRMEIHKSGKPAITQYKVIEKFRLFSLLEITPKTGRTHQIRVHLSGIGCPLAVDQMYGSGKGIGIHHLKKTYYKPFEETERPLLINRLTLHAHKIDFIDPITDEPRSFEAQLPKDFMALLKGLRKWGK
jgi:23S rRNA pseudouridine955/2504/2580 synthase/23S rRNA pseudouridine1911/1915/1917 synthase